MPKLQSPLPNAQTRRLAAARSARASNQPVVGIIGAAVPVELILAMDGFALRVAADPADLHADSTPMESGHEPEIRSLFRQAVSGMLSCCDLLVIASTSDGYRYLFQYLHEMQRTGRGAQIPPLLLYDFLFGTSPAVADYNRKVLQQLQRRLAEICGRMASDESVRAAIVRTNTLRRKHARLQQARHARRIAGVAALEWIANCVESDLEAATIAADSLLAAAAADQKSSVPRLIVASGVPLYHSRLHAILEAAGAIVTLEDDEWGARRHGPEIDTAVEPIAALLHHYCAHTPSPRQPTVMRQAWLREQLRCGKADGLVLYAPPSDQFFGWECPQLMACAREHQVPALLVRREATDPAATNVLAAEAAAFLRRLSTEARA